MDNTNALMVFCEGAHDVAFLYQILKHGLGAKRVKGEDRGGLKFSEYPSPLNNFFKTKMENHAAKDLSQDMAKKFFLPDLILEKNGWFIFIFNSGGKTKYENIKLFIKEFSILHNVAGTFAGDAKSIITDVKYLFFYDADEKNIGDVGVWMHDKFSTIEDIEWQLEPWSFSDGNRYAIQSNKAIYIWGGEDEKGTLEDIIYPIYSNCKADLIKLSEEFVDSAFCWDVEGKEPQRVSKIKANKLKALICIAGQGERPGRPLSAIINDNVLGDKDIMTEEPVFKSLVGFLSTFVGFDD